MIKHDQTLLTFISHEKNIPKNSAFMVNTVSRYQPLKTINKQIQTVSHVLSNNLISINLAMSVSLTVIE